MGSCGCALWTLGTHLGRGRGPEQSSVQPASCAAGQLPPRGCTDPSPRSQCQGTFFASSARPGSRVGSRVHPLRGSKLQGQSRHAGLPSAHQREPGPGSRGRGTGPFSGSRSAPRSPACSALGAAGTSLPSCPEVTLCYQSEFETAVSLQLGQTHPEHKVPSAPSWPSRGLAPSRPSKGVRDTRGGVGYTHMSLGVTESMRKPVNY